MVGIATCTLHWFLSVRNILAIYYKSHDTLTWYIYFGEQKQMKNLKLRKKENVY